MVYSTIRGIDCNSIFSDRRLRVRWRERNLNLEGEIMTSPGEAVAHSLTNSKMMVHRFIDDLKPDEFLHRPAPKANCVAWLIGHLALADRNVLKAFGVTD